MKPFNITGKLGSVCLVLLILLLCHSTGHSMTPEEIFEWVASELQIEIDYEMPVVIFIDKETLADKFIQNNQKTIRVWINRYGQAQAEKILQTYCNDIRGIFDQRSQSVYIGNFLKGCRAQAVLAHEFVHYFQNITHEFENEAQSMQEIMYLFRELQACSIEDRFVELFCEIGNLQ